MFAQTGDQALKAFRQLSLGGWSVSCYYRSAQTHKDTCTQTCSVFSHKFFNMPGHRLFGYTSSLQHLLDIEECIGAKLTYSKLPALVIMSRNFIAPPSGRNVMVHP